MSADGKGVKRVAVYCGSSNGNDPSFLNAAVALGAACLLHQAALSGDPQFQLRGLAAR